MLSLRFYSPPPPQLIRQIAATTQPLDNIQIGDHISLGNQQFIKLNNNGLLMMSSTLSCPHGKVIAGKHVKCFNCPADATYDSTNVSCTCNSSSQTFDWDTGACILNGMPSDADTTNCTPVGYMDTWDGCSSLAEHETVCLADPRDYRTYRVRKLADGKCWMIDSLKFGGNYGDTDGCSANSGVGNYGSGGSQNATMAQETFATGYYGHCRAINSTYNNYLYDWVAALQSTLAYYGSSTTFTPPQQGICPTGWHLPSGNTSGEYGTLVSAYNNSSTDILDASKGNFALSGDAYYSSGSLIHQGIYGLYWSSTAYDSNGAYNLWVTSGGVGVGNGGDYKADGFAVRCIKN